MGAACVRREALRTCIDHPRFHSKDCFANHRRAARPRTVFLRRHTRDALADALAAYGYVCCLCAPTLAETLVKRGQQVTLLDLDERFAHVPGFQRYDLTKPEWLESEFDVIVCDPPFFTVSLTQLRQALATLSHHRTEVPVLVSYLTRRDRKILTNFAEYDFRPTGFYPS
ncbi:MAG: hypothetical protein AAFQ53_14415, partial [Bacteroidota bacterium]